MKMIMISRFFNSRKKAIAITLVVIVLLALALLFFTSTHLLQNKNINAYFENPQVKQGEQAVLMVNVYNNANEVINLSVIASTSSDSLVINNAVQEEDRVGIGESRLFSFNVLVKPDARKGNYVIRVNVPQLKEESKVFLKVI